MLSVLTIVFFVFGLIVGSFLNVVIYRYNTKKSMGGRSACMSCREKLCWYELIPLVSFFLLEGRCRNCKTKISRQYPLVEFISGVIFAGIFLKFQDVFFADTSVFGITYAYYAGMFSLLLVIATYDWKHKIIPDPLVFVFGCLAFIGMFLFSGYVFLPHTPSLFEISSGVAVALPFGLIWLLSRGAWMGLGDAKLIVGLGWLLGLSAVLSGIVVAFWVGAVVGVALIIFSRLSSNKYSMKSEIPFAPFLVLGAFLSFVLGLHFFPIYF